jgi:uncharacterized protein (TIGR02996 family)
VNDTEERGFLGALEEEPGDDTSWLVYADWLEDRGDPRAEYVRVTADLSRGAVTLAFLQPVSEYLKKLGVIMPAAWTEQIIRLRAARPLRFRIVRVNHFGGHESETRVRGILESGTVSVGSGVAIPLTGGSTVHGWVRGFSRYSTTVSQHSAGQEPLECVLILPGQPMRVIEGATLAHSPEGGAGLKRLLCRSISELELSTLAQNCLASGSIASVLDLVRSVEADLFQFPGFDEALLREIRMKLAGLGLCLGMWLPRPE